MNDFDLDRLQESVVKSIARSRYGEAMVSIKSFTEQIINDPETIGVVFASHELDSLCRMLADKYYAANHQSPDSEGRGTVILASELVSAGGHVELIKDYLSLGLLEQPVRIALTDLFNRTEVTAIKEWESLFGCEIFIATATELDGKLDAVSARLREWNPSGILSLGHNQDVVCVVAAHVPGTKNRYYIHHGDHHLSLGVTCEAFQHVDLHNMAYDLCKNEIGVIHQLYWPITAARSLKIKTKFLERGALTTCSCGRMSKFEADTYAISYERAVACILKASCGYHVHIGDLSDEFLQKIHRSLHAEEVSADRFVHIKWVPSLAQALIENGVDVYLTSFPISGGKAVVEAMSVGVPVVTHESYRSRYHSSRDLIYPAGKTWSQYKELSRIFEQWNESLLKQHSELALDYFRRYYSKDTLLRAYASEQECASLIPPLRTYRQNRLEDYLDHRRRRVREAKRLESEYNRLKLEYDGVVKESAKILSAYEAHCETIRRQQEQIEKLAQQQFTDKLAVGEADTITPELAVGEADSITPELAVGEADTITPELAVAQADTITPRLVSSDRGLWKRKIRKLIGLVLNK